MRAAGPRAPVADCRGVVYVEFLLAFGPLFVLFLAIAQLALIGAAQLVVQHAAHRAVRAAVVVLEDDPARYDGVPRREIAAAPEGEREADDRLASFLGADDDTPSPFGTERPTAGGPRLAAIRRAAHVPLAAIVPDPVSFLRYLTPGGGTLADAVDGSAARKLGYGLAVHLPLTTAVTFPTQPGSERLHEGRVPRGDTVTVRVTHLFHCAVPVVAALVCRRMATPDTVGVARGLGLRSVEGPALAELQRAPLARAHGLLAASAARFAVLRAEATLPAQDADYLYEGESEDQR